MTKGELFFKHKDADTIQPKTHFMDVMSHTKISIQHAIEVLEEYDNRIIKFMQEGSSRDGAFITPETAKDVWYKTRWHLELAEMVKELKKQL